MSGSGATPPDRSENKPQIPPKPLSEKGRVTLWSLAIPAISSIIVAIATTVATIASKSSTIEKLNDKTSEVQAGLEQAKTKADQTIAKATALTIPPGTIAPYGGPIDEPTLKASGWLPCDGRLVRREDYRDLFHIIQTSWGEGDKVNTFNLPDLRGYFLRGVSGDQLRDPDRDARQSIAEGGNVGNRVGSVQNDSTRRPNSDFLISNSGQHSHTISGPAASDDGGSADTHFAIGDNDAIRNFPHLTVTGGNHSHTINGGGDVETRPKNAYVYYIIKY